MDLLFEKGEEKKHSVRYEEVVVPGSKAVLGTLYVKKAWLEEETQGKAFPKGLAVTINIQGR